MQTQEFHEQEAVLLTERATDLCGVNYDLSQAINDLKYRIAECSGDTPGKRVWQQNASQRLERMQMCFVNNDRLIQRLLSCSAWHGRQADKLEREWNEGQTEMSVGKPGTNDRAKRKAGQRSKSMAANAAKDKPWRGLHIGPHGNHGNQPKNKVA